MLNLKTIILEWAKIFFLVKEPKQNPQKTIHKMQSNPSKKGRMKMSENISRNALRRITSKKIQSLIMRSKA